jgi:hypothetical protein
MGKIVKIAITRYVVTYLYTYRTMNTTKPLIIIKLTQSKKMLPMRLLFTTKLQTNILKWLKLSIKN